MCNSGFLWPIPNNGFSTNSFLTTLGFYLPTLPRQATPCEVNFVTHSNQPTLFLTCTPASWEKETKKDWLFNFPSKSDQIFSCFFWGGLCWEKFSEGLKKNVGRTKLDTFFLGGKNSIVVGPGRRNPLSAAMLVTCLPHFSPENERLVLKNDAFPSSESPLSRGLFSGAQCLVFVDVIKIHKQKTTTVSFVLPDWFWFRF